MRYHNGGLIAAEYDDGLPPVDAALTHYNSIRVADLRQKCQEDERCVSFSYFSEETRFPMGEVVGVTYPYADWHLRRDAMKVWVEETNYHTYINTTREIELVVDEVDDIVERLKTAEKRGQKNSDKEGEAAKLGSRSRLRGDTRDNTDETMADQKVALLSGLFDATMPKAHKSLAVPIIAPYALKLATSERESYRVRLDALRLLIVLADMPLTGKMLLDVGVYETMMAIINKRESWDDIPTTALDVISNICLHRGAKERLHKLGAPKLMRTLMEEPGFPGLQATLALTHLGSSESASLQLEEAKLNDLVQLLKSSIDGDVVYDIKWDLIPGPLSGINYLVEKNTSPEVYEQLLDLGLVEQLLRIIDETGDCRNRDAIEQSLEIIAALVNISERARHMVLLAEHTLHEAEQRFNQYGRIAAMASGVLDAAARKRGDEL